MGTKIWRRTKGEAGLYVQRAVALRKLGISLADFRRLCILKGVFPRIPKKKPDGRDKVYYHVKDIAYLNREPILDKYHQQKAILKKVHKALFRKEPEKAKLIAARSPKIILTHIIKERYPTLVHALRDMDDALSCLALFASMPVTNNEGVTGEAIRESQSLMDQWLALISTIGGLEKAFASIKGYYYQVTVLGQKIVWLMPHEFTTTPSQDVDLKPMVTFLELYRTLVKFVLYKLYALAGLIYPPTPICEGLQSDGGWLNLQMTSTGVPAMQTDESTGLTLIPQDEASLQRRALFHQQVIYVSRETPLRHMCFAARACGAQVVGFDENLVQHEKSLSPITVKDNSITHHVVDRPLKILQKQLKDIPSATRNFVQPQWLLDSINNLKLLPTGPYAPGSIPPAHLSPFVNDRDEGYVTTDRLLISNWAGQDTKELTEVAEKEEADEEDRMRRLVMLPKKKRQVAERIMEAENAKKMQVKKLKSKKKKIEV